MFVRRDLRSHPFEMTRMNASHDEDKFIHGEWHCVAVVDGKLPFSGEDIKAIV